MMDKKISPEKSRELIAAAKEACKSSYSPYSRFAVGAAILLDGGEVVTGCNVENASYGLSLCAERSAMAAAVMRGAGKPIAIAIVCGEGRSCPPCGACRQFLAEFNPRMTVILEDSAGSAVYALEDLLPVNFALEKEENTKNNV